MQCGEGVCLPDEWQPFKVHRRNSTLGCLLGTNVIRAVLYFTIKSHQFVSRMYFPHFFAIVMSIRDVELFAVGLPNASATLNGNSWNIDSLESRATELSEVPWVILIDAWQLQLNHDELHSICADEWEFDITWTRWTFSFPRLDSSGLNRYCTNINARGIRLYVFSLFFTLLLSI